MTCIRFDFGLYDSEKMEAIRIKELLQKKMGELSGSCGDRTLWISTGFETIDRIVGGWKPGELIVIGGRTAIGKTTLALNMVYRQVVEAENSIAYFAMDIMEERLVNRLLSLVTGIPFQRLNERICSSKEQEHIINGILELGEVPLFIDCRPRLTVDQLLDEINDLYVHQGVRMVYVDYLQFLAGNEGEFQYDVIGDVCFKLKVLASELRIPIVLLSELNRQTEYREGVDGKIPQLGDLRGSGRIEELADKILMVHRPEYYQVYVDEWGNDLSDVMQVFIVKHKDGPLGTVDLSFDRNTLTVRESIAE